MNVSAGGQHMKTIHVPKSMMSAPFLQVTTYILEHSSNTFSFFSILNVKGFYEDLNEIIIFVIFTKVTVNLPCIIPSYFCLSIQPSQLDRDAIFAV